MIPLCGFAGITSGSQTSAFYVDNIRFTEGNIKEVPFRAYISTPTSVFFLSIFVPEGVEIICFEDEETGDEIEYKPGEDIKYQYINYQGQEREGCCELYWDGGPHSYYYEGGDTIINGKPYSIYHLIGSGIKPYTPSCHDQMTWQPVSYFMPSEHYKMFSLCFVDTEYNSDIQDGIIGDIFISTYTVNYSHIIPHGLAKEWRYCYRVYREGHYYDEEAGEWIGQYYDNQLNQYFDYYYHFYYNPDCNGDYDVYIADYNTILAYLLELGPESGEDHNYPDIKWEGFDSHGDVNLDGHINLADFAMFIDAFKCIIFEDECPWYSGYVVEVGQSTARVRRHYSCGDVDGDGKINIADVTQLINYLLVGNPSVLAADVDDDERVTISDVTALINYLLTNNW